MLYILCIGGGGGGGGGFTGAAAASRGGGGGGGGSGQLSLIIPICLVPDILYIQSGMGGLGVSSGGGVAPSGILSHVSIFPDSNAQNLVATSGGVAAAGGTTGTGAAAGAAGAGGGAAVIGGMLFSGLADWTSQAGQAGSAGGAQTGATGASLALPSSQFIMGGTGGAGTASADFAGGGLTSSAGALISTSRPMLAAAGSNPGSSGHNFWKPFFSYSGLGGASSNTGVGGAGGYGSWGSGGGGGGGGTTGGRGGNGGSGLVIMLAL